MSLENMTIFQIFGVIVAGYGLWQFLTGLGQGAKTKENIAKLLTYCVVAALAANLNNMVTLGDKIVTVAIQLVGSIKIKG
jgi:hypothetical protein